MDNILYSDKYETMSPKDFMKKYVIRNDDPIDDIHDLRLVLFCLLAWSVEKLPTIVLDYIWEHPNLDYTIFEKDFPLYYSMIRDQNEKNDNIPYKESKDKWETRKITDVTELFKRGKRGNHF